MRDWDAQDFFLWHLAREGGILRGQIQVNMFTAKLQRAVPEESSGQKVGFTENLEAIANAEHQATILGKLLHCLHHGAEARNGSGAKIIAVAETARHQHGIDIAHAAVLMPQKARWMAQDFLQDMHTVLVAV